MEESFLQDLVLSVCILAAVQSLLLESEGFIQEAAEMNAIFDKKAHFFASENFPFGSEMVYDSTAFEAVYGYGKRIHSEHVMAAAAKASFANRGKQPVWYLYNTDVRGGGDTEWNTSYMTQLGEYLLIDYALDEGHVKEDWILSYYGAFLSVIGMQSMKIMVRQDGSPWVSGLMILMHEFSPRQIKRKCGCHM